MNSDIRLNMCVSHFPGHSSTRHLAFHHHAVSVFRNTAFPFRGIFSVVISRRAADYMCTLWKLIFVLEISALFCMYVELDEKIKKLCKNGIIRPKVEVFV